MGDKTAIGWTEATWNPTVGCDRVSDGCTNCYALTMAKRLKAMGQPDYQRDGNPVTSGPGFGLTVRPHMLDQPLRWRRPRRIFVNSMSDLFHAEVPDEFIARVFAVMALAPQHTFQILTKRHARMRALLSLRPTERSATFHREVEVAAAALVQSGVVKAVDTSWPLPNVALGVSVENQQWADIRIPALVDTLAAVRFLSCEPLIAGLTLRRQIAGYLEGWRVNNSAEREPCPAVDWVIVGGESGRGARPMDARWATSLRDECEQAGVAFFFKQAGTVLAAEWGCRSHKGTDPTEWPEPFPQEWPHIREAVRA